MHERGQACVVRHCPDPVHRLADELAFEVPFHLDSLKNLERFPNWGFGGGSQMEAAAQDRWYVRNGPLLGRFLSAIQQACDRASPAPKEPR